MKIDVSKIQGFNEMTAEEKLKALTEYDIEIPKDESKKYKDAFDKTASELASVKKQLADRMTEEEKAKAEREANDKAIAEELNSLRREKNVSEHSAKYLALGFSPELATQTANAMVDGKYEEVYSNMQTFMATREKEILEKGFKGTPVPGGGNPPQDKENMSDAEYYASLKTKG